MNRKYRVTHKGYLKNDCTEFYFFSVFLHLGFLEGKQILIFVLNHLVNHQNTQLNAETKKQA